MDISAAEIGVFVEVIKSSPAPPYFNQSEFGPFTVRSDTPRFTVITKIVAHNVEGKPRTFHSSIAGLPGYTSQRVTESAFV